MNPPLNRTKLAERREEARAVEGEETVEEGGPTFAGEDAPEVVDVLPGDLRPPRSPESFLLDYHRALLGADLPANAKLVAFALGTFAGLDGSNAFPSATDLADVVGLAPRTVQKWIARLRDRGFLAVVPFRVARGRSRSLFVLSIPDGERGGPRTGAIYYGNREYGEPAKEDSPLWERARTPPEIKAAVLRIEAEKEGK